MAVYVDPAVWPFGRMKMCHCWADSDEELLTMMRKIGVNTKWIQGHPRLSFGRHKEASWVHFDISKGMREKAIQAGAIVCDRYAALIHTAKLDLLHTNPAVREYGFKRIRRMIWVRTRRRVAFRFSRLYNEAMSPRGIQHVETY